MGESKLVISQKFFLKSNRIMTKAIGPIKVTHGNSSWNRCTNYGGYVGYPKNSENSEIQKLLELNKP